MIEAAKEVASHPATVGGLIVTLMGWLANRVWRGHRHELANMKQETANLSALVSTKADRIGLDAAWKELDKRREVEAKLFDQMRDHEKDDRDRFDKSEAANRDRHDELMTVIGDIRADIAGLRKR